MADHPTPPPPEDPALAQIRVAGRMLVPYLALHYAVQLTAARFQASDGTPESAAWRHRVITESARDVLSLIKLVL